MKCQACPEQMTHISEGYLPIKHLEVPLISIRLKEENEELKKNTPKRIQDELKKLLTRELGDYSLVNMFCIPFNSIRSHLSLYHIES